jgi:hypothetical protein
MSRVSHKLNNYEIVGDYTVLYIVRPNGDKFNVYIDTEDLDKIKDMYWHITWHENFKGYYVEYTKYLGYVDGKPKNKVIFLHKIIMNSNDNEDVDHVDGNTLDNRKSNLRISTHANNNKNRRGKNKNNKSGYRNVCLMHNKYRIQLQINGRNHLFPEKFSNVNNAGAFAKEMREKYYGEFAGNG